MSTPSGLMKFDLEMGIEAASLRGQLTSWEGCDTIWPRSEEIEEMDQGSWNIALGVGMLVTAAFAGVPGLLALMEDTPNAKRLRSGLWKLPALAFFCAPAVLIWLDRPFTSAFAAILAVLFFAVAMFHAQKVSLEGLLPLVISSLFCSLSLTLGMTERMTETLKAQVSLNAEIASSLKAAYDRLETVEKALVNHIQEALPHQAK